jgi:hypothetical protein
MSGPSLSVIVIFHSRLTYLAEAIASVTHQSLSRDRYEIIVVGPKRPEVLDRDSLDHEVKFVESSASSLGGNILDGLHRSSGEVATMLEDDDRYLPRRLECVQEAFQDSELTFLQNGYSPIDALGNPFRGRFPHDSELARWRRIGTVTVPGRPPRHSLRVLSRIPAGFNNSSISIRRKVLSDGIGLLGRTDFLSDVTLLYLGLTHRGVLRFDPTPLTQLRVHAESVSNPASGPAKQALESLHRFSNQTQVGRRQLLTYVEKVGPTSVTRQVEGLIAISDALLQLRSSRHSSRELSRALLSAVSRLDTFEVESRAGAILLAMTTLACPPLGKAAYERWWASRRAPAPLPKQVQKNEV